MGCVSVKSVWEVCELNDDVKYGRLDPNRFAVELHSVLDGTADRVYTDPDLFLRYTYPTSNMKYLLKEALLRLSGKGGQSVFVLDTEFGGGKTHTLLLLYHVFRNKELGTKYIRELNLHADSGVLEVPSCRVVAIDCRGLKKNTLWGEIAEAFGRYEEFKEEDLSKKPVLDISKLKSLFNEPTLLLIDELPDYLLKASAEKIGNTDLSELTISFVLNLISAVSATRNSMLIITLTGMQRLYEKYVMEFKQRLKEVAIVDVDEKVRGALSRQAQYLVPVEKEEISHIIRRRLIKEIVDEKAFKSVVESYYNYFNEKGVITDITYKRRLEDSYPFHPMLIDILYERVSTIESFNKTRGVLRLLALILHRVFRDRVNCALISPGDIPLDDPEINDELTSRLGRADFKPVIEADCIGKARKLDEKRSVKLVEKIARTIYLHSLIGAMKVSGILPSEVKIAVGAPGIDLSLVDEILSEIDREFWYLKSEHGAYYFDKEPNINKIIHDYMAEVSDSEIRDTIKEELEDLLPKTNNVDVVIWDRSELKDNDELKIFVVDYRDIQKTDERDILEELLEKREGGGIRTYRNTIIFLLPERVGIHMIEDSARRLRAIEMAKEDERIKLDKERIQKLKERLSEAKANLELDCTNVYTRIAYPSIGDGTLRIDTLPLEQHIDKKNMTNVIIEFLKMRGKLVEKLSPDIISDIVKQREKIKIEDIYDLFRQDKSKPFIPSGETLFEAIHEGVMRGKFGYAKEIEEKDGKYLAEIGKHVSPEWGAYLIKEDLIYKPEPLPLPPPPPPPPKFYKYILELSDLRSTINTLNNVLVVSVGKEKDFEAHLKLEISDRERTTKIIIESENWQKIKGLKTLIEQFFRDYTCKGTLTIQTKDEEIIKDIKRVRGETN